MADLLGQEADFRSPEVRAEQTVEQLKEAIQLRKLKKEQEKKKMET